jgi:hypothetical protein
MAKEAYSMAKEAYSMAKEAYQHNIGTPKPHRLYFDALDRIQLPVNPMSGHTFSKRQCRRHFGTDPLGS